MSATLQDVRPSLLMISACVPAPNHPRRHQAWRLLEAASQQHSVHLVCVADGPVNLQDWRRLDESVGSHVLLPQRGGRALQRAIREIAARWQTTTAFEVVMCDMPELWPAVSPIDAPLRIDASDRPAALRALLTPRWHHAERRAA